MTQNPRRMYRENTLKKDMEKNISCIFEIYDQSDNF